MSKIKVLLLILFNLIIAAGFYLNNINVKVESISSDLGNIIPICKKIDDPRLFKHDLYLENLKDVEYYTPFFVQTLLKIATFSNYDYLQSLNILSFITHFLYGILWFFLFYKLKKDFWLAFFFSVFIRGILWVPGAEILGISDLWSIMPRTIYVAIVPLPFIIYSESKKYAVLVAAFVLGLIFNIHPITGIGGIFAYFSIFISYRFYNSNLVNINTAKIILLSTLFCLLGMLPFLLNYITKIENDLTFDSNVFNKAFLTRISSKFTNPLRFIQDWSRPVTYFFGFLFLSYYIFDTSKNKIIFKILFITAFVLFLTANLSVYIEMLINDLFNKNLRMSFQLIRFQKLIIIIFQLGIFFLTAEILKLISFNNKLKPLVFLSYIFLLIFSSSSIFSRFPFIGDDLTTSILPNTLKVYTNEPSDYHLSDMIDYIDKNTAKDAVFYGSFLIRTGAQRSVVLDSKGAGMLIEGNPIKFIAWYNEIQQFKVLNDNDKILFLRNKKVDYIVDDKPWEGINPIKTIGNIYLYKINFNERN